VGLSCGLRKAWRVPRSAVKSACGSLDRLVMAGRYHQDAVDDVERLIEGVVHVRDGTAKQWGHDEFGCRPRSAVTSGKHVHGRSGVRERLPAAGSSQSRSHAHSSVMSSERLNPDRLDAPSTTHGPS
jgi:hypothetical protein